MKANTTSNIDKIIANWTKRANNLTPQMAIATKHATMIVYAEARKQMRQDIYDKPTPTLEDVAKEQGLIKSKTEMVFGKGLNSAERRKLRANEKKYGFYGGYYTPEENQVLMRWITKNGKRILVPLSKKSAKQKAWRRTGNLRRSEHYKILSPYEGIIYNDADYAAARHDLGIPGKSNRKTTRPAHWRNNAVDLTRNKVKAIYRKAMKQAINAGIIIGPGTGGLK